jgi:hypothetical protein
MWARRMPTLYVLLTILRPPWHCAACNMQHVPVVCMFGAYLCKLLKSEMQTDVYAPCHSYDCLNPLLWLHSRCCWNVSMIRILIRKTHAWSCESSRGTWHISAATSALTMLMHYQWCTVSTVIKVEAAANAWMSLKTHMLSNTLHVPTSSTTCSLRYQGLGNEGG